MFDTSTLLVVDDEGGVRRVPPPPTDVSKWVVYRDEKGEVGSRPI